MIETDYDFSEDLPHIVSELICLKCLSRWIGVYPSAMLLKEITCEKCGEVGFIINTGQELETEND